MPAWPWTHDQIGDVTNAWPESEAGALVAWAMWAADSLDYLVVVDDVAFGSTPRILHGQHPDTVDVAHVRWASGTAVTAIDLCAAALGRRYCGVVGDRELSVPTLARAINAPGGPVLPKDAATWLHQVRTDSDYKLIKRARNPLTHARHARTLSASTTPPGPHDNRVRLPVGAKGALMDCRDLVVLAQNVAFRHVNSFVDGVMHKRY